MSELDSIIKDAEVRIRLLARRRCRNAEVSSLGATHIHPRHLAFWIMTQSDEERDRLQSDARLSQSFRAILLQLGYPAEAVPLVAFAFESQETVDRDFSGSWHYAMQ